MPPAPQSLAALSLYPLQLSDATEKGHPSPIASTVSMPLRHVSKDSCPEPSDTSGGNVTLNPSCGAFGSGHVPPGVTSVVSFCDKEMGGD